jgi:uncharacterized membrane-anchored protein
MKSIHLPAITTRYWAALMIASVLGANLGDYFSEQLGFGHARGLPLMLGLFLLIFFIEHVDRAVHQTYYWLSIVVVRTAATNVADLARLDFKIKHPYTIAALSVFLLLLVIKNYWIDVPKEATLRAAFPTADIHYWISMLVAGTLGTAVGDYSSFGLRLGLPLSTVIVSAVAALILLAGSRRLLTTTPYYWLAVVAILVAGTSGGDWLANGKSGLGLPFSTLCAGLLLATTLIVWRKKESTATLLANGHNNGNQ